MVNAIVWIAFIHSQEESNLIHMGICPKQRFHGVAKIMKEFVISVITQADTDGHSRCIKLWLPFYNQTTGRRVWKAVRMPGENTLGDIHTFSMAIESQRNRKTIKCLIRTRINPNLRSVRFRASSLSSLTDNLVKVLYKGKSNE